MRPVNGIFLYWTGGLQQLFAMADGIDASVYDPLFRRAIETADRFTELSENTKDLPDSVAQLATLRAYLAKLQEEIRANPKATMTLDVRMAIAHSVNRFQTVLEREIGHLHTYVLEAKRGHSPVTLLHVVETLIDNKWLPYLSEFTRYNLDDAGTALVFDRFTACGYHTMRAVEDVARRYYQIVSGREHFTVKSSGEPVYLNLGQIANELTHILAKTNRSQASALKLIAPSLEALCEIYRNPLSHPEVVVLAESDAIDVFLKGIDLITTMIRDVVQRGPLAKP
jgi:hypothetical protein